MINSWGGRGDASVVVCEVAVVMMFGEVGDVWVDSRMPEVALIVCELAALTMFRSVRDVQVDVRMSQVALAVTCEVWGGRCPGGHPHAR